MLVAFVVTPMVLLYGVVRLSRWQMGRRDPIDSLICTPRWCTDGDGFMNTYDRQKVNRAGEHRWQETLRAQRRLRKPATVARPDSRRFLRVVGQ